MATYAENLATLQANYAQQLVDISAAPKLSYTVGDRTFSWTEYQQFLLDSLEKIEKQLQHANGPFIVRYRTRA